MDLKAYLNALIKTKIYGKDDGVNLDCTECGNLIHTSYDPDVTLIDLATTASVHHEHYCN